MIQAMPVTNYSSTVQLKLIAGGREFELASIGPDSIALRSPVSLTPCEGQVLMTVDGHERTWKVSLPEGAVATNRSVRVRRV